jgi:hypothetical protein
MHLAAAADAARNTNEINDGISQHMMSMSLTGLLKNLDLLMPLLWNSAALLACTRMSGCNGDAWI